MAALLYKLLTSKININKELLKIDPGKKWITKIAIYTSGSQT